MNTDDKYGAILDGWVRGMSHKSARPSSGMTYLEESQEKQIKELLKENDRGLG